VPQYASPLERHIQTVIQIILVALLLWSGNSIIELKDKMARVETQLVAIQTAQTTASTDRYPRTQAVIEFGEIKRQIKDMDESNDKDHLALREWLQSLRDRIIALEAFARTKGFDNRRN